MLMDKLRQPHKKNNLSMTKSSLLRHLLNLKVLPTSKALKLYTTLSETLTTNCFAPMFKRKLDKWMMNCDNCLRHFSETLTNRHWMSSVKTHAFAANEYAWHVQMIILNLDFCPKNYTLNGDAYLNECILKWEITAYTIVLICAKLVSGNTTKQVPCMQ